MVVLTNEAIEASARAAQGMGFAINNLIAAAIVEPAFRVMFGNDVQLDSEELRLAKLERVIEQQVLPALTNIGNYLAANDQYIQGLKRGSDEWRAEEIPKGAQDAGY